MGVAATLAPAVAPARRAQASPSLMVATRSAASRAEVCECGAASGLSGRCEACDRTSLRPKFTADDGHFGQAAAGHDAAASMAAMREAGSRLSGTRQAGPVHSDQEHSGIGHSGQEHSLPTSAARIPAVRMARVPVAATRADGPGSAPSFDPARDRDDAQYKPAPIGPASNRPAPIARTAPSWSVDHAHEQRVVSLPRAKAEPWMPPSPKPRIQHSVPIGPQTRLLVGSPEDPAELEARAIGKLIARMGDPAAAPPDGSVAPPATGPTPAVSRGNAAAPVMATLDQDRSAGAALPDAVRGFMEPRFGADFSGVRIHTGEPAAALSAQFRAQAFTLGRDIYFGRDQFQPGTVEGRELIAHELTHTIQQGGQQVDAVAPAAALPGVAARTNRQGGSTRRAGVTPGLTAGVVEGSTTTRGTMPQGLITPSTHQGDVAEQAAQLPAVTMPAMAPRVVTRPIRYGSVAIPPAGQARPIQRRDAANHAALSARITSRAPISVQRLAVDGTAGPAENQRKITHLAPATVRLIERWRAGGTDVDSGPRVIYRMRNGRTVELPPGVTAEDAAILEAERAAAKTGPAKLPPPHAVPEPPSPDDTPEKAPEPAKARHLAGVDAKSGEPADAESGGKPLADGKRPGDEPGDPQPDSKAAPVIHLHMPEPPDGPSPATRRRITAVKARAGGKADAHATLPAGEEQVKGARKAVTPPDAERAAAARAALIAQVHAAPSPEIVKLCEKIRDVIRDKRPPDEDALAAAQPESAALDAGNELNTTVQEQTKKVQDNYDTINTVPPVPDAPKVDGVPPQPAPATTAPINATAAVPDAVPASSVSLDQDAADTRKKARDAGMETEPAKLVRSGPVAEARAAQGELDQVASADPAKVLATQKQALDNAEGDMAALQEQALTALTTSRAVTVKGNTSHQHSMVDSEETQRAAAGDAARKEIEGARSAVDGLIKNLASNAMAEWTTAKDLLVTQFKSDLAIVQRHVDDRHSGVSGFFVGLWDDATGLPDWATDAYTAAEKRFGDGVIEKLTKISADVNSIIAACDVIITGARERIHKIFSDLPRSLQDWAAKEQVKFDGQLDQLHNHVISTRDSFNKDLIERSSAAVDEVRTEIAELREKASGLIGRIVDAVGRFIDDPVRFIIEGLLGILGIAPAAFWAVVAKIKKYASEIADDPLEFAGKLMKGLGQGFSQFFDHFGEHMITGFLSWLFGDLKGVELPGDLSPRSVITFFMQLMGVTWANIRKIIVDKAGASNVALVEKTYAMVSMFIEMGPSGIYEMIKDKLDPQAIVSQVIDMAVDYMVTAIAKQVAVRLLLLFNPVGAILEAIEAIYHVLKWIFQNAARIFTLIETVVNGIGNILSGNLGGFANAVEKALEMLIPPVISFLADYFSLGDLPSIVASKIKSMQTWILGMIERAVVWIIDKGKALLAAVGIGKKPDDKKPGVAAGGKIGETVHWTAGEESHELWIADEAGSPVVMVASDNPGPVKAKLADYDTRAKALKGPGSVDRKARAATAITQAGGVLDGTTAAAKATKAATTDAKAQPADVKAKNAQTDNWEEKLWPHLQTIEIALHLIKLPPTVIAGSGGMASTVIAEPLSKLGEPGSKPKGKMKGWRHVMLIDHEELNPKAKQWGPAYWVAGHLVSELLHGPGDPWNTVPMRKTDNSAMRNDIEKDSINRINNDEVLYYRTDVRYDHPVTIPEGFPSYIEIVRGTLRYDKGTWVRGDVLKGFERPLKAPELEANTIPNINNLRRAGLYKRGVPIRFAMAMDSERDDRGDFTAQDFEPRMTQFYDQRGTGRMDNLTAGVAIVQGLIADKKVRFGT